MEPQREEKIELNFYVTFHGALSDKLNVLPEDTNLIVPSCCGNVNLNSETKLYTYFEDLKREILSKLPSHPRTSKLNGKPYKYFYSSEPYCDIILDYPSPFDAVPCGIKLIGRDELLRIQPVIFNDNGFNLMKKIISLDRFSNLSLKQNIEFQKGHGLKSIPHISQMYSGFLYNLHFNVCKEIANTNWGFMKQFKYIKLSPEGLLIDLELSEDDIKILFHENSEITEILRKSNDYIRIISKHQHSDQDESDLLQEIEAINEKILEQKTTIDNASDGLDDFYKNIFIENIKKLETSREKILKDVRDVKFRKNPLELYYEINYEQNYNLLQKIKNIIASKPETMFDIIKNSPYEDQMRYEDYFFLDNNMKLIDVENIKVDNMSQNIKGNGLINTLIYGYYLACTFSSFTETEYEIFDTLKPTTQIIGGYPYNGLLLSEIIEFIKNKYSKFNQYNINIINESCQGSNDTDDVDKCVALYCITNTFANDSQKEMLKSSRSRTEIVHILNRLKISGQFAQYFDDPNFTELYNFSEDDLMVINFVHKFFLNPIKGLEFIVELECLDFVIWLAGQNYYNRSPINKACVYANASLILKYYNPDF